MSHWPSVAPRVLLGEARGVEVYLADDERFIAFDAEKAQLHRGRGLDELEDCGVKFDGDGLRSRADN